MMIKIVSIVIMIIDNNEITVPTPKEGNMISDHSHKAYITWTELRPSI